MALNEEKFKGFINTCRDFNYLVGTKVREAREGNSLLEVEMRKELCNRWGIPHGGVVFTLADTAAGVAAMSAGERRTVTVNANMNYLRCGVSEGKMTARGKTVKAGRSLAFVDVEVFDAADTLVATGQFTMAYNDEKIPELV